MARTDVPNISIDNAQIRFRNFTGEPTKFDKAGGKRTFSVILDPDMADKLRDDGWNVKSWEPEGADEPIYHLPVEISYKIYPPKVWMISGNKKTMLQEDTISALQYAEFTKVQLIIRPYCWEVNGKSGIKAYVKAMYVTIEEDEFEKEYRNFEDDEDELPF
jgi:hypothetical protein